MSSVSGLSPQHVQTARGLAVQAARLCLHRAVSLHYTETGDRFQGIEKDLKAWRGETPTEGDCSSTFAWWIWNGLDHFHVRDVVNGENWKAGYTGTMLEHGRRVTGQMQVCDAVIYGSGWPGKHVAMYVGGGMVISHGSEAGPFLLPYRYRPDVMAIRRYI